MSNPNCLFYIVNLNEHGEPILGTMQGHPTPTLKNGCNQALLPSTQMSFTGQVLPPSGLHYYYKVDANCNIVPNSMFSKARVPENWSSGSNRILEYVLYSNSCNRY